MMRPMQLMRKLATQRWRVYLICSRKVRVVLVSPLIGCIKETWNGFRRRASRARMPQAPEQHNAFTIHQAYIKIFDIYEMQFDRLVDVAIISVGCHASRGPG